MLNITATFSSVEVGEDSLSPERGQAFSAGTALATASLPITSPELWSSGVWLAHADPLVPVWGAAQCLYTASFLLECRTLAVLASALAVYCNFCNFCIWPKNTSHGAYFCGRRWIPPFRQESRSPFSFQWIHVAFWFAHSKSSIPSFSTVWHLALLVNVRCLI